MREAQNLEPLDGIAVIGMAGRFPGARDVAELWRNLCEGVEAVRFFSAEELRAAGVPAEHLARPDYVRARAVLEDVELFDAGFFGLTPREAEVMAPEYRLFLEQAWTALEDAGHSPAHYPGRIGVFAGAGMNLYLLYNLLRNPEAIRSLGFFQTALANDKDQLTTRVAYKLGLRGPAVTVQTACSTSLVAVHLACQSLLGGECDMAIAGGVSVHLPQLSGYLYQEGGIGSADGHCRAFDAEARGTVGGSGVAVVVLKPLESALADGDPIDAVIRGSAINNDGSAKVGFTAPGVDGQAAVIAEALAVAGVEPASVGYVEAHGTGTPLGDPIEVRALTQAFRRSTVERGFCALGSVKTNLGHLDAAAGATGLIKTVLALKHGCIPPTLHFCRPNPALDLAASPFWVATELCPWPERGGPRRAGVSSFGIGGTNAHAVLEQAPVTAAGAAKRGGDDLRSLELLVLSARSPAALDAAAERLADFLEHAGPETAEPDLGDVAHTLRQGRTAFGHRAAVLARTPAEAARALRTRDPERFLAGRGASAEPGVVFLFPGQGTQHPGMGAELYRTEPLFRAEVDRACELLVPHLGCDLRAVLYPPEGRAEQAAERLLETALAQPALFVIEHALARLWLAWGVTPRAMLGHSLGEYVAACLAGVMSLPEALALVAARGRLMQQTAPGAMLAVELGGEELASSALLDGELAIAALNAPASTVAAGPVAAVGRLAIELAARGVRHRRLHTAHAFHSPTMEPILEAFAEQVRRCELRPPQRPYLSNLTGTWIRSEQATDPGYWVEHLRRPVRFAAALSALEDERALVFLELGAGQSLSTLVAAQAIGERAMGIFAALPSARAAGDDAAHLLRAVGRSWLAGVEIDWGAFEGERRRRRVHLPTYPFERQRHWVDPAPPAAVAPAVVRAAAPAPGAAPAPAQLGTGLERVLARQLEVMRQQLELLAAQGVRAETAVPAGAPPQTSAQAPREVPLTPIQRWFFELAGELAPESFGQGRLLVAPAELDPEALERAAGELAARHDALRLCYRRLDGVWRQLDPGEPPKVVLERVDLSRLAAPARAAAIAASLDRRLQGFDLERGPLLALTWLDCGRADTGRLLLAAHHLAVDLSSWQMLTTQLRALYTDPRRAPAPSAPGFVEWARWLAEHARSAAVKQAAGFWLDLGRHRTAMLPADLPGDATGALGPALVSLDLDPAATRALFTELRAVHGFAPHEPVLTALAAALARWAGGVVPIELEGHGRESAAPGVDPWGTVGWLTCLYPIFLELPRVCDPEVALMLVARQLRAVPEGGLAYGLARYLGEEPELGARLAALPRAEVSFHFAGRLGGNTAGGETGTGLFAPAPERPGLLGAALRVRPYALEVDAVVSGEQLRLNLRFDPARHARTTIEALGRDVLAGVCTLVERLRSQPPFTIAPTTEAQRGLWAVSQLSPEAARAYNETLTLRLRGPLDVAALRGALAGLAPRHAALRTGFDRSGEYQKIQREACAELGLIDLGRLPAEVRDEQLRRGLETRIRQAFDLAAAPLWRASLLRLSEQEHVLLITVHHLVIDARSFGVLFAEVRALYDAARTGRPARLAATADPAELARQPPAPTRQAELAAAEAFWLEQFRTPLPNAELPADRPRPAVMSLRGARAEARFDTVLYARLRDLAAGEKATLFVVLLAGFTVLLHRLTKRDDLVLGFHAAGQPAGARHVGFFINMLPLRSRIAGGTTFVEHLRALRRTVAESLEHQVYSFSRLVKRLNLRRDPSRPPLVSIIFNLERSGAATPRLGEVAVEGLEPPVAFARFELLWDVKDDGRELAVGCTYNRDLFDGGTVVGWMEQYRILLERVAEQPALALAALARELEQGQKDRLDRRRQELKEQSLKKFAGARRRAMEV